MSALHLSRSSCSCSVSFGRCRSWSVFGEPNTMTIRAIQKANIPPNHRAYISFRPSSTWQRKGLRQGPLQHLSQMAASRNRRSQCRSLYTRIRIIGTSKKAPLTFGKIYLWSPKLMTSPATFLKGAIKLTNIQQNSLGKERRRRKGKNVKRRGLNHYWYHPLILIMELAVVESTPVSL